MLHPNYNENMNYPDIAVLELDTRFQLPYDWRFYLEQQQKFNEHSAQLG